MSNKSEEGPTAAVFFAIEELNGKMAIGMKEMQQALIVTRKEKNEILMKSEQENLTKFDKIRQNSTKFDKI